MVYLIIFWLLFIINYKKSCKVICQVTRESVNEEVDIVAMNDLVVSQKVNQKKIFDYGNWTNKNTAGRMPQDKDTWNGLISYHQRKLNRNWSGQKRIINRSTASVVKKYWVLNRLGLCTKTLQVEVLRDYKGHLHQFEIRYNKQMAKLSLFKTIDWKRHNCKQKQSVFFNRCQQPICVQDEGGKLRNASAAA